MALPKMNVPQYKIELPSTGEQINMRPYLVKEEKVLMIALESNDPVQISEAVRNIIMSCYSINSLDDLTVFDIEYLFLMLRAKSVGEKMNLQIKCVEEGCGGLSPITIDVADVEIINKNQDRNIMLDKKSGIGVVLNYPSLEMIANLDAEKLNSSEGMMDVIVESIDSIFDNDVGQIIIISDGQISRKESCPFKSTNFSIEQCASEFNKERANQDLGNNKFIDNRVTIDAVSIGENYCNTFSNQNNWMGKIAKQNGGRCSVLR